MRPMLYKELLAARPQLTAVAVIGLVLFVGELLAADSLRGVVGIVATGIDGLLLLTGGLAFALGHGQIGPEVAHGHVEWLDGLPLNRTQVYLAKLVVGLLTVVALAGVTTTSTLIMTQLTWGDSPPQALGVVLGALTVGLFAFYSTGLLLSWVGGFGWAVLGFALTVITTAAEIIEPLRPMSIFHGFGTVRFEANEPIIVLWPLVAWAIHGAVCIALSGLLFVGRGDRLVNAGSGLANSLKTVMVVLIGGLIVVMASVTATRLATRGSDPADAPTFEQVEGFRVMVPKNTSMAAQQVIEQMPQIDADVRRLLGAQESLRLDVELAGGGRFHAGLYTGGKIRMALDDAAAEVFAHELTHAYVDAITKGAVRRHHNAMRFFNEGLAMWAAERVIGSSREADRHRAWAGALYELGQHHLDPLMDDRSRALMHDPFEPYPLGLIFVESLVVAYGEAAVPCLLREAAELPDRKLVGEAIWSRLFAACNLDWARLATRYDGQLLTHATVTPIPTVPIRAQPRWLDGRLVLIMPAPEESNAGVRRRCRFRSRLASSPADLDESVESDDGPWCAVRSIISATETVSFQVGIPLKGGWTAYGPWIQQPVPPRTGER